MQLSQQENIHERNAIFFTGNYFNNKARQSYLFQKRS